MAKCYVRNIKVNKLFHLQNFEIPVNDEEHPHLIITGKNGSGKTVLLTAIADFIEKIKEDKNGYMSRYSSWLSSAEVSLKNAKTEEEKAKVRLEIKEDQKRVDDTFGKVNVDIDQPALLREKFQDGRFIVAFYKANRKVNMSEPKNPTKPNIHKGTITETSTREFLNFLSDLKIQEALARNEKQIEDADKIDAWFTNFERILRKIFQDQELKLQFNYKDYTFHIITAGKSFKFNEMSDGYAAVLDIVVDLILKMQHGQSVSSIYDVEGIVLIDEIETHLHLALQRIIMPMLTSLFPNIQFIVTTHSPFILNSMNNASAYDLEHKQVIKELADYSYDSLVEGYFDVDITSSYMDQQLCRLEELLAAKEISDKDKDDLRLMINEFEKIPSVVYPSVVGKYQQLKIVYIDRVKEVMDI